jgi:hypothetical protein
MELIIPLLVVGTSIWVLADANSIGAKKGLLPGVCDMGPGGWFMVCLLLWIIGFPAYVITRPQIVEAIEKERMRETRPRQQKTRTPVDQVEQWERQTMIQQGRILPSSTPTIRVTSVSCPLCAASISEASLRIGENTCPECAGIFKVEAE